LSYNIIKLTHADWLDQLTNEKYDLLLAKPPGLTAKFKQLYDERIHILEHALNIPIYPSPLEIYIYENKRYFYSWMEANNLPHARTRIFYDQKEAMNYIAKVDFPIVGKTNIGASGSGVKVINNLNDAHNYINQAFTKKGVSKRWGPNFSKGGLIRRGAKYFVNPSEIKNKVSIYKSQKSDSQNGFVIFQQFIPHDFEWRIVAIGDSYFAHKKLKIGEKASGSTLKNYDNPPSYLFTFAREIMEKFHLTSQAIDVFEDVDGRILINEMQCIFGQSDQYQMLVDGKRGRYKFIDQLWVFEEGEFNRNSSFNLRLESAFKLISDK
ncbi:MAG: hypothetical protein K9I99_10135, partial [Melioribacteraceae bacterium]|nr:hypothetical protein [Melioribacteraceae bacterium]